MQGFEIELERGETDQIMTTQIAATLYSQLDNEGRKIMQCKGIIDHNSDWPALMLMKETGLATLKGGCRKYKTAMCSWNVLVEWWDETTTWMGVKDVKETSPIELAEYAVANKIVDELAVFMVSTILRLQKIW